MYQALRVTRGRTLSSLKAMASVKAVYTLAFAALLATGILLAVPPTSALAASCSATCEGGSSIEVSSATSCSCQDFIGCTWTSNGRNFAAMCGTGGPPQ